MNYDTLIATGCSYTNYTWKTWADHLGDYFPIYKNLGQSGSGPRYSWMRIQRYLKYQANYSTMESTVIAVQWSSLLRNYMYILNQEGRYCWPGGGQVNNNIHYSKDYLDNYFDLVDKALDLEFFIENLILASEKYKFRLVMFYMLEPWIKDFGGEPTGGNGHLNVRDKINEFYKTPYPKRLEDLYNSKYWVKPSIELFTAEVPDPNKDPNDHHPSPLQHFHYANKIKEHLGLFSTLL